MKDHLVSWSLVGIEDVLLPFDNKQTLRQGWSPQCERFPAETEDDWGVLKTTAIQDGEFQPEHNKQLPAILEPDPLLEVEEGDLLLTCAGPRVRCGVVCLVRTTPKRLMISGKMYRFRTEPRLALASYLEAFLRSHDTKKRIDEMKTGISDSGLNLTLARFKTLQVPLPPLAEQKRIVAKIEELFSELDQGIENLKLARAQLAVYRQTLLKHAFEGKLTADWRTTHADQLESADQLLIRIRTERQKNWQGRGKYKEPTEPYLTNPSQLPPSWANVSWEMVLSHEDGAFKRGPFGSSLTKSIFVKAGFKVYEQYCPINDDCSFARYYITPEKFEELRAFEVKAGDYLISCSGVTLGRITRVPENYEIGIINQALLRVRLNEKVIAHRYFLHLFRSGIFQKAIFDNSTGTAIPNVKGVKELKAIALPLPSIAEQIKIVEEIDRMLSVTAVLEADIDANLLRVEALRQSILKKAFAGELVPQDPNDEPAAALLARIRSERAALAALPKPKKPRPSKG